MRRNVYNLFRIVLVLLVIATLAHAFYQSSLPVKESVEQSDKVGEIIEEIIPPETAPGEYIQKNLRKLAHFTEFFMLGLWSALFVTIYMRKRWALFSLLPFGMISALLDETVQLFSKRGASVGDVWIDVAGFASAALVVLIIYAFVLFVRLVLDARYE